MRSTHSFAINIIKRSNSANKNAALLYARITLDGERAEISLKEKIPVNDWDGNKEIVKGKTVQIKALNQYIDDVRYQIKDKYRLLQETGLLITAETVKQAYLGLHTIQKGHKLLQLTDYFHKIWEEKLGKGSFKNYRTTIDYIRRFLNTCHASRDLYLSQLNMEFVTELEHYIRNFPIKEHDPCLGFTRELMNRDIAVIYEADSIIASNLQKHYTIDELARMTNTNSLKLKVGFNKVYGMGVFKRLVFRRMEHAKMILSTTDKSIGEVAGLAGYDTVAGFIHAFRREFGLTPREWRKNERETDTGETGEE